MLKEMDETIQRGTLAKRLTSTSSGPESDLCPAYHQIWLHILVSQSRSTSTEIQSPEQIQVQLTVKVFPTKL